jgi:hypothetical protein
MLHCGIKSPRATQRLVCNPGVVSETLACFYASAAVNWFENKVNQFTAARTPCETRAAQSPPRCALYYATPENFDIFSFFVYCVQTKG